MLTVGKFGSSLVKPSLNSRYEVVKNGWPLEDRLATEQAKAGAAGSAETTAQNGMQ